MRKEDRLKRIRDVLLQQEKATWTEIHEKTKISTKELSYDLKELLDSKEITCEQDTKDRRRTWYMLKDKQRAFMESRRYDTTDFIMSMKEPIFQERQIKKDPYKALISIFGEAPSLDRKKERDYLKQFLDELPLELAMGAVGLKGIFEKHKIEKFALVFAFEKEGDES
ncbi:hypothetical protein GTO27_12740 [Candidatus Bathyarchaeota archaeon]|nr:hypothetical protein [Candidatus Bathyarchaeota archaeon]